MEYAVPLLLREWSVEEDIRPPPYGISRWLVCTLEFEKHCLSQPKTKCGPWAVGISTSRTCERGKCLNLIPL